MKELIQQDKQVICIALESLIRYYTELLEEHPSDITDGAFKMAKAITEGVLEHFKEVQA